MRGIIARRWMLSAGVLVAVVATGSTADTALGEQPENAVLHVFNDVAGRTKIKSSVPEKTQVKAGETVCELDASVLDERIKVQELVVRSAEADLRSAQLDREVAELALLEFNDHGYGRDLQHIRREVALAESRRLSAEDRLFWSDRMLTKGYVSVSQNLADKLSLESNTAALEEAQSKRAVLEKHLKQRTLKSLSRDVENAKAIELAKQANALRETFKLAGLKKDLAACKVVAKVSGRVHYPQPIGTGAVVREGQLLFQIVQDDPAN